MNILYLTYDGLTDPLGQSQILPYLFRLSAQGFRFTVISCEKPSEFPRSEENIRYLLKEHSIDWVPLSYTKKPPVLSTLWDIRKIRKAAVSLHKDKKFRIVHCRSYITAFVGLYLKKKYHIPFLFDMRGFWADERVEGEIWNRRNPLYNGIYSYFKMKETDFLNHADHVISLTDKGREEMLSWKGIRKMPPVEVIPCCVDTGLFNRDHISGEKLDIIRNALHIQKQDFVLTYLGTLGTWYMLTEMLDFFARLLTHKPEAKFFFITAEDPKYILMQAARKRIPLEKIIVTKAARKDVPAMLSISDISLFFIKPVYSKTASSPTKLGELMSMGIPVITNSGVGDVDAIIKKTGCGILLDSFSEQSYDNAIASIDRLLKTDRERIRQKAEEFFSLEKGADAYKKVYEQITEKNIYS